MAPDQTVYPSPKEVTLGDFYYCLLFVFSWIASSRLIPCISWPLESKELHPHRMWHRACKFWLCRVRWAAHRCWQLRMLPGEGGCRGWQVAVCEKQGPRGRGGEALWQPSTPCCFWEEHPLSMGLFLLQQPIVWEVTCHSSWPSRILPWDF